MFDAFFEIGGESGGEEGGGGAENIFVDNHGISVWANVEVDGGRINKSERVSKAHLLWRETCLRFLGVEDIVVLKFYKDDSRLTAL